MQTFWLFLVMEVALTYNIESDIDLLMKIYEPPPSRVETHYVMPTQEVKIKLSEGSIQ